jgi:hypothetical protein
MLESLEGYRFKISLFKEWLETLGKYYLNPKFRYDVSGSRLVSFFFGYTTIFHFDDIKNFDFVLFASNFIYRTNL